MMAPVPSFLLERFSLGTNNAGGGGNGGERGEGAGEGRVATHSAKGLPHRKGFPANEELGNLWSEKGTAPVRLLLLRSRRLKLGSPRSGIGPERELFARLRTVRPVRFLKLAGIGPVKELKERSRTVRLDRNCLGRLPVKLFSWR